MRLSGVEDMANLLLASRDGKPVGTKWARRFVDAQPSLKTQFNRLYDYQRALCEDPEVIKNWFRLFRNMMAKYGITNDDLDNFNKTGYYLTPNKLSTSLILLKGEFLVINEAPQH
jgi:hypothetical protein